MRKLWTQWLGLYTSLVLLLGTKSSFKQQLTDFLSSGVLRMKTAILKGICFGKKAVIQLIWHLNAAGLKMIQGFFSLTRFPFGDQTLPRPGREIPQSKRPIHMQAFGVQGPKYIEDVDICGLKEHWQKFWNHPVVLVIYFFAKSLSGRQTCMDVNLCSSGQVNELTTLRALCSKFLFNTSYVPSGWSCWFLSGLSRWGNFITSHNRWNSCSGFHRWLDLNSIWVSVPCFGFCPYHSLFRDSKRQHRCLTL